MEAQEEELDKQERNDFMKKVIRKMFLMVAVLAAVGVYAYDIGPTNESIMIDPDGDIIDKESLYNQNNAVLTFTGGGITNGTYNVLNPLSIAIDKTYFDSLYMPLYPTQVKISSNNTISGSSNPALAFGTNNNVNGSNSASFGTGNVINATNSVAFGLYSTINSNNAYTFGQYLRAQGVSQVVVGRWNVADSSMPFIIGYGSSNETRTNVFTVDATGNVVAKGDFTNGINYTLKQTLQVNYDTKKVINDADARKFKDNNTIGDYSGLYVFVDTYGGGAVPYTGQFRNYINAPSTNDCWFFDFQQSSSVANVNFQITDSASAQNAVLTPIVSGNVNANTLAVQNFRIQNTSYPITGTFSLTESGGSTATEYSGSLTAADGRIAMDLLSGKITGNLSGTQTGSITFPATTNRALYLRGNPSGNTPNAVKYVSEYFTDVVAKLISPSGEVLWCMTTGNFNSTPLVTLYPTKVDRNAKVYYYTNTTIVNGSGKTVEAPKKAWDYVNGQLASNGTRYWTIGQYETLNGNLSAPYYKIRVTGIEIFPDLSNPDFLEAFSDPRNTLKVWRSHGVYGAEYVGIRNNDPTYQDTTAPIWKPAKLFYTKPTQN